MENIFTYTNNTLRCEQVALADIARDTDTPCYVYSGGGILDKYRAYDEAFDDVPHRVCYSVKANSNLSVLSLLAKAGAGFDIVSGGELFRVIKAGGDPSKVIYSGVGKTAGEIEYALEKGIHSFNCESEAEMELINALAARRGVKARVAVRVNPDVDPETHPYIATGLGEHKFGIDISKVEEVYQRARSLSNLDLAGVSCHIGSQLLNTEPLLDALEILLKLIERLRATGIQISYIDLGGGIGIPYNPADKAPDLSKFVSGLRDKVKGADLTIIVEPGRSMIGEAGVLLTRVLYRKRNEQKEFIVVDASMTDLIRPSLYGSHHEIIPLRKAPERGSVVADIVGPVCETGDFLARGREIADVYPGDLLAICSAGAYGFAMASNYNSRLRCPEVLVEGDSWRIVRARETYEDLVRGE